MLGCFRSYSLINDLHLHGHSGGTISTLAFCILEMKLAEGIVCLDKSSAQWIVARNKEDLLKAAGSTYEYVAFDFPWAPHLAQIGKPCDIDDRFSPKISLFCSHSYRKKGIPISESYAHQPKSKIRTIFDNPLRCFLCSDHIGKFSDVSVGDTHSDPKINVVLVHSNLGRKLLDFAVNHKYLNIEKIEIETIKKKQPYLWRRRL